MSSYALALLALVLGGLAVWQRWDEFVSLASYGSVLKKIPVTNAAKQVAAAPAYILGFAAWILGIAVAVVATFWAIGWAGNILVYGFSGKTPESQLAVPAKEVEVVPLLTLSELQEQYTLLPFKNGWQPLPERLSGEYVLTKDGWNDPVYSGLNAALAEGGKLQGLFPESSYAVGRRLWIGSPHEGDTLQLDEMTRTKSLDNSDKRLYFNGEGMEGAVYKADVVLTPPPDAVRIATWRNMQSNEEMAWGAIPPANQATWKLYVCIEKPDGSRIESGTLMAHPGALILSSGKEYTSILLNQEEVTVTELRAPSEEEGLEVGVVAPGLADGVRLTIILRLEELDL